MDLLETIKTRRSIRRFKPTDIPDRLIHSLIDSARHAPSAGDTQPWEFIIVKDESTKERLAQTHAWSDFVTDAPVCIVVLGNEKISSKLLCNRLCLRNGKPFAGSSWSRFGRLLGGGLRSAQSNFERHVRAVLNVPSHLRIIAMVPIGYTDEKVEPRKLHELNKILHFDKY